MAIIPDFQQDGLRTVDTLKKQLPMWHRYRVELYPHIPGLGLGSGIRDKHGHEVGFPAAFRQSRRDGTPRRIVRIRHGGLV